MGISQRFPLTPLGHCSFAGHDKSATFQNVSQDHSFSVETGHLATAASLQKCFRAPFGATKWQKAAFRLQVSNALRGKASPFMALHGRPANGSLEEL